MGRGAWERLCCRFIVCSLFFSFLIGNISEIVGTCVCISPGSLRFAVVCKVPTGVSSYLNTVRDGGGVATFTYSVQCSKTDANILRASWSSIQPGDEMEKSVCKGGSRECDRAHDLLLYASVPHRRFCATLYLCVGYLFSGRCGVVD